MYAWIWRKLPFGKVGKSIGSVLLIAAAVAGLWFWAFPNVETFLPFDDVNVTDEQPGGGSGQDGSNPSESLPPDDVIPYSTSENQAEPSPSR